MPLSQTELCIFMRGGRKEYDRNTNATLFIAMKPAGFVVCKNGEKKDPPQT